MDDDDCAAEYRAAAAAMRRRTDEIRYERIERKAAPREIAPQTAAAIGAHMAAVCAKIVIGYMMPPWIGLLFSGALEAALHSNVAELVQTWTAAAYGAAEHGLLEPFQRAFSQAPEWREIVWHDALFRVACASGQTDMAAIAHRGRAFGGISAAEGARIAAAAGHIGPIAIIAGDLTLEELYAAQHAAREHKALSIYMADIIAHARRIAGAAPRRGARLFYEACATGDNCKILGAIGGTARAEQLRGIELCPPDVCHYALEAILGHREIEQQFDTHAYHMATLRDDAATGPSGGRPGAY